MTAKQMRTILEICAALSAERDREALLSRILDAAMDLTRCDGGTLYLLGPDGLHFCRMVTRSLGVRQGGHDAPITLPPVPLSASTSAPAAHSMDSRFGRQTIGPPVLRSGPCSTQT